MKVKTFASLLEQIPSSFVDYSVRLRASNGMRGRPVCKTVSAGGDIFLHFWSEDCMLRDKGCKIADLKTFLGCSEGNLYFHDVDTGIYYSPIFQQYERVSFENFYGVDGRPFSSFNESHQIAFKAHPGFRSVHFYMEPIARPCLKRCVLNGEKDKRSLSALMQVDRDNHFDKSFLETCDPHILEFVERERKKRAHFCNHWDMIDHWIAEDAKNPESEVAKVLQRHGFSSSEMVPLWCLAACNPKHALHQELKQLGCFKESVERAKSVRMAFVTALTLRMSLCEQARKVLG